MHQEILLGGGGQMFYVEPVERPRRPASVVVKSHSGVEHAATTSCEIDPVETTLAEPAQAGSTRLRLRSTAGIAMGTRYAIARLGVVVTAIDGDRVTLRRPLALSVAASEPFLGCRISAAVDPTWVASAANVTEHLDIDAGYLLTWTFHTQSGAPTTAHSTADLVRTAQLARVTPDDVEERFPGWAAMVDRPHEVIDEAFDLVRREARLHRSIRRARHAFQLRELAMLAANMIATEQATMFRGAPKAKLAAAEERYQAYVGELVAQTTPKCQPREPAPTPTRREPPPLSVAHAPIIDELMEWVASNPLTNYQTVYLMETMFRSRLKSRDERRVAVMFLRAKQPQLPKQARKALQQVIYRLRD